MTSLPQAPAAGPDRLLPAGLLGSWLLTLVVPGIICAGLGVGVTQLDAVGVGEWRSYAMILIRDLFWILVGIGQWRLLRRLVRRAGVWAVTTAAGGILGLIASSFVVGWIMILGESFGVSMRVTDGPMFLPAAIVGGASGGGVIGFMQAAAAPIGWRLRWRWVGGSVAAGGVAYGASSLMIHALIDPVIFQFMREPAVRISFAFRLAVALLVGTALFGIVTGFCMRWLLRQLSRAQVDDLLNRFD